MKQFRCHYCKLQGQHTSRRCPYKPPKNLKTPEEIQKWHEEKKTPTTILNNIKLSFDAWRNKYDPSRKEYIQKYFGKSVKRK